jgi:hypothetical protein
VTRRALAWAAWCAVVAVAAAALVALATTVGSLAWVAYALAGDGEWSLATCVLLCSWGTWRAIRPGGGDAALDMVA